MQTFLPFPNFIQSAAVLDRQRLGKQRVETMQIMRALLVPESGWSNHPATKMWAGHAGSLLEYQMAICAEWVCTRGYNDTCLMKTEDLFIAHPPHPIHYNPPSWLGSKEFHASHRSNLLRKDPEYYGDFGWSEPNDLEYVWPINKGET